MLSEFAALFSAVKASSDIAKSLLDTKLDHTVAVRVSDMLATLSDTQQKLLATQVSYAALIKENAIMKQETMQLKDWAEDKKRYQLHELAPGTLVYRIAPMYQATEPAHDLCPQCYQEHIKAILQFSGYDKGHICYSCSRCKTSYLGEKPKGNYEYIPIPKQRGAW